MEVNFFYGFPILKWFPVFSFILSMAGEYIFKMVKQSFYQLNFQEFQAILTLSLPQVTKTEFLLTILIKYQAGRWWE